MNGIFITGTDTGVGKTHVSCLIASQLFKSGLRVGVMKPAESGCCEENGRLVPEDALNLKRASGCDVSIDEICPYAFPLPLAPAEAAKRAGVAVDVGKIEAACHRMAGSSDFTLVEGAGGLLVPLSEQYLFADLARDLRLPLLIVARAGLGTVNHSLLTFEAARNRGIRVAGIVLNESIPHAADVSYEGNRRLLSELVPVPVLGPLPHASLASEEVRDAVIRDLCRLIHP
ncbi:MAG: dethiobiotin synthase [Acidobacteriota bacterium]